jgi:hypothetical protein
VIYNGPYLQYSSITLTRFTTCYFYLTVASCFVQVALQAATFSETNDSTRLMSTILAGAKIPQGFSIIRNGALQICDSIPGQNGTHCIGVSGKPSQNFTVDQIRGSRYQTASNLVRYSLSSVSSISLWCYIFTYTIHRWEAGRSLGKHSSILLGICRASAFPTAHLRRRLSATNA